MAVMPRGRASKEVIHDVVVLVGTRCDGRRKSCNAGVGCRRHVDSLQWWTGKMAIAAEGSTTRSG